MGKATDASANGGVRPSRIVVLVDASPDALHALEAAAELARRYRVPLLAVSVEEPERARSAAFPFAREVGAASGSIRPLDEVLLRRRRERGPEGIRRAVERASRAADVAWEMLNLHGRLVEEALALSRPGDFLMLGRVGWSARLGRKLGRAPLALAREARGTVHICSAAAARERGRIAVLIEDSESAGDLLTVAAGRARAAGRDLLVLLAPTALDVALDSLPNAVDEASPRWRVRSLSALSTGEMLRALAEEDAAELVVGRGGGWLNSPAATHLLSLWRMPILVTPVPAD